MKLEAIRGWQFQRLDLGIETVDSLLAVSDHAALRTYRDGGEGWTVVQVLGHLRDFEAVFLERAQLTVTADNPALPFPDPDELAHTNAYQQTPWQDHLAAWRTARKDFLAFLRARSEADWERVAQHPTRGALTLHDQLFLATLHDGIHLEQITRILKEKRDQAY